MNPRDRLHHILADLPPDQAEAIWLLFEECKASHSERERDLLRRLESATYTNEILRQGIACPLAIPPRRLLQCEGHLPPLAQPVLPAEGMAALIRGCS